MNDITALAQRMKAAAEKATPGRWEYLPGNTSIEYNVDSMDEDQGSIVYVDSGDFNQTQTDQNGEFIALANPANVLALVEALEKAQAQSSKWLEAYHKAVSVGARYEESIAELELAVKAKQAALSLESAHLHVRQRRLEAVEDKILKMAKLLTDIKNSRPGGVYFIKWEGKINEMLKDDDISELESRTVTVKLPEYPEPSDPFLRMNMKAVRTLDVKAMIDAGIQVIEGEA